MIAGKTRHQGYRFAKRSFDLIASFLGLLVAWPAILVCSWLARASTGASGVFRQTRVGKDGRQFTIYKIRTMRPLEGVVTTVTVRGDQRITTAGRWMRRLNLDELPQLWNILQGSMSFVGPRPDVPGFADALPPEYAPMLELRPGITGPATLAFRSEEVLLAAAPDPVAFNAEQVFPCKAAINLAYARTGSFWIDVRCLWQTVFRRPRLVEPFSSPAEVVSFMNWLKNQKPLEPSTRDIIHHLQPSDPPSLA